MAEKMAAEETKKRETKKRTVVVVGHKNPDTDSICSAIAYADIKNRTSQKVKYIPKRAGQINEETEFVLKYFGKEGYSKLAQTRFFVTIRRFVFRWY